MHGAKVAIESAHKLGVVLVAGGTGVHAYPATADCSATPGLLAMVKRYRDEIMMTLDGLVEYPPRAAARTPCRRCHMPLDTHMYRDVCRGALTPSQNGMSSSIGSFSNASTHAQASRACQPCH
jgi:hypothetical protein